MIKNSYLSTLLLAMLPASALAGDCMCDTAEYIDGLYGKKSECFEGDQLDAFYCMYALSYSTEPAWRKAVDGLLHVSKTNKNLAKKVEARLLEAKAYLDKPYRQKVQAAMKTKKGRTLWSLLVQASDGDATAKTKLWYRFCSDYPVVVAFGRPAELTELWPPPKGTPKEKAYRKLKCAFMQDHLLNLAMTKEINPKQLALFSKSNLRFIRNVVFARKGRSFTSEDLTRFFKRQPWYKPDPGYKDEKLTAKDKAFLKAIQQQERRR